MTLPKMIRRMPVRFPLRAFVANELHFPVLGDSYKKEILVKESNKNKGEAGTAFDYLLRFYIEYLNKDKITSTRWVAESGLYKILDMPYTYKWDGKKTTKSIFHKHLTTSFADAKKFHKSFIKSGELSDDLLKSCLFLARLDVGQRAITNDLEHFGIYKDEELKELRDLFNIIPKNEFIIQQNGVINPSVGPYSDGDLVLDDFLIEIKTVSKLNLTADYKVQLIYYYILTLIHGVNRNKKNHKIKNLGIYFSRYGLMVKIPINEIGKASKFKELKSWLIDYNNQNNPWREYWNSYLKKHPNAKSFDDNNLIEFEQLEELT